MRPQNGLGRQSLTVLPPESVVSIAGNVVATEKAKAGFEVVPTAAKVLNLAAAPLPFAVWDDKIDVGGATDDVVRVAGRVLLLRDMGKLAFATVRDGTGDIQFYVSKGDLGDDAFARFVSEVDRGDWIAWLYKTTGRDLRHFVHRWLTSTTSPA